MTLHEDYQRLNDEVQNLARLMLEPWLPLLGWLSRLVLRLTKGAK